MPWVRVDDSFYDHPKFRSVTVLGVGVWVLGLAYANRNLTDGFIPERVARSIVDTAGLGLYTSNYGGRDVEPMDGVTELLNASLWHEVNGGYQIHDYLDYNFSAERIRDEREKNRLRQSAWREKHALGVSGGRKDEPAGQGAADDRNAVTNAIRSSAPNPNPKSSSGSVGSSVTEVDARDAAALAPLRHSLESVRLIVRWDKLGRLQRARILELVAIHGIPALVTAAQRAWQPADPPAYANAWLNHWEALPPPLRLVSEVCDLHKLPLPCRGCAADAKAGAS